MLLLVGSLGAGLRGAPAADDRILVVVCIPPQAYFVERIASPDFPARSYRNVAGGSESRGIRVVVLIQPGQSHHTLELTPKQVADLSAARIFFKIGLPFEERLLEKLRGINPALVVVDTCEGVALRRDDSPDGHDDAPGHHSDEEPDPHTWLSPQRVKIQAGHIAAALAKADPAHADAFAQNLKTFTTDLDRTDRRIHALLDPFKGRSMFVFHPAFGYFADDYGLRQVAVEFQGKEPAARELAGVIEAARAAGTKTIFVQAQFSPKSAETVAREIGGRVMPLDPMSRDYLNNLEAIAETVADSF